MANLAGGVLVIYAIGVPALALIGDVPLGTAFTGSMAFVPGDVVKAVAASFVAVTVRRSYPVIEMPGRRPVVG